MSFLDTPNRPDPAHVPNNPLALRYGLIWGGVSALTTLIGFLTNTDPSIPSTSTGIKAAYSIFGIGVAVWAIATAIKDDRDNNLGGFISMGRGTGLGAKIGVVSGVVSAIFTALYMTVINPGFMDQMREGMMAEYEKAGMGEEQIEMAMSIATKFVSPVFIGISALIGSIILGTVIGLIAGAILKKE